ncbi:hypothetical protein O181_034548 [Austropuccinia psidii MF-1]|uniref:Uncharacterized protein n=1 Tax=Austropuccinia psidii MF-1 TaxID=1389203 RepID=A0A9Q3D5P7_9BASI|nr:hypothetical protein [Austropuccinia psidii MF-1]
MHSEGLITGMNWTPIATQRNRKPQNSASIQGKPTLTTFKGKITIINPVVTSKGKLPKAVDRKFVQRTVKETLASKGTSQRREKACPEPEDLQEDTLDTVKCQTRALEGYGSSSSAHQLLKDLFNGAWKKRRSTEHPSGQNWGKFPADMLQRDRFQRPYGHHQRLESHQKVQNPGDEGKQHKAESNHYPSYRRKTDPDREYPDSLRLTRSRINQLSSGFTPIRNQKISGQEEPIFTISGSFQEKIRIQGHKQDLFQPKEEIVRPNHPEAIEHNVDIPESNIKGDALWLHVSQFSEKTQEKFAELQESHERMKTLTASMEKIVKTLQEGHAQLSKSSEETNKRLNQVFDEQHRDCLDQDVNKLLNVYHNMKPQQQGHVMDNPYHQEDIKTDAIFFNKARSPSQYQDG